MRLNQTRFFILAALAGLLACAGGGAGPSDTDVPDTPDVTGTYGLKSFMTTTKGVSTDQLEAGADLILTLRPDGTTTGQLVEPVKPGETVSVLAMTGTWTLTGTTVRFEQDVDSYVRRLPFLAGPNRLDGEGTIDGRTFRVSLTR
jgi:hypothetical protein